MKKLMFLVVVLIVVFSQSSYCDEKDSVEKYKGTEYIGDIFKEYDTIPLPIKLKHKIAIFNTFMILPAQNIEYGFTEIGIQYNYRIPRWIDGLFGWTRS